MRENSLKSYLMILSAMLIFSTLGIFRRYIPLSSGMLACTRGFLGSAFLLLFIFLRGRKLPNLGKRNLFLLAITGALIGVNWIFMFEAYNYTTVAMATMCYYMQPTIVVLISPIVLRERITGKKLACAITAIIGMVFLSGIMEGGKVRAEDMTGMLYALGAAGLYASVIILNKKIQVEDSYVKTVIQLIFATLILIPYLLVTERGNSQNLDMLAIIMVIIVGIVHTGIAYALYFGSMKELKAQSIAVLSYTDPVFALILSALVLHEQLSIFGMLGAVLIIGSALISEISVRKPVSRLSTCQDRR
ncbi:DMT family transporter [Brotaphodocola sp.]|uniref:DMT family transporter n=1 Tax=Brotaphodocola sp. TaxID=3073577 RepID=UPI003D7CF30E